MTEPQEPHPGWSARVRLDPVQSRAQGARYTNAAAYLARELALSRWVDDECNTVWHPGPVFSLDVEHVGGDGQVTDLVARIPAVWRPDGVPDEVLDHVHGPECEHVVTVFSFGWCCQECGNLHIRWRLCAYRCVATAFAVNKWMEYYVHRRLTR